MKSAHASASAWNWAGARWWKFDFHAHTPASCDFSSGHIEPRDWLLAYMRAGIDCVAVTDHNTGNWIDRLKSALEELKTAEHPDYRELHIFPGVEISAFGGVHVLAIFDPTATTAHIENLLGAVEYQGQRGEGDGVTRKSLQEVIEQIESAGGIAIPAHVDLSRGLFRLLDGSTLGAVLKSLPIPVIEVVDINAQEPPICRQIGIEWTKVLGSDAHSLSGQEYYPGSRYTWVKMSKPSLEGLMLALIDGDLSVRRSDTHTGDPNAHANAVIEEIRVHEAKYMGRRDPLVVRFNPWLNAIIGGRGTGKSTLIEFLRIALRRWDELPKSIRPEFEKYQTPYSSRTDPGLLTEDTRIQVIYRKDGTRYRIQWDYRGSAPAIEVEQFPDDWESEPGVVSERFPVRICSQRQVFELARDPKALLSIVDAAPEVNHAEWNERWEQQRARYLSLKAKERELKARLADESRLKGELQDVKRKLAIFEQAGYADVLREYRRRERERQAVEEWEQAWSGLGHRLREQAESILPPPIDSTVFDNAQGDGPDILRLSEDICTRLEDLAKQVRLLAEDLDRVEAQWKRVKLTSKWWTAVDQAKQGYEQLKERLREADADDPSAYGQLVQESQLIQERLQSLDSVRKELEHIGTESAAVLDKMGDLRREMTQRRQAFLSSILESNPFVRMKVVPYGDREGADSELREYLGVQDKFEADITALIKLIYPEDEDPATADASQGRVTSREAGLAQMKARLRRIAAGSPAEPVSDPRFAKRVAGLPPEALDRLDCWYPQDTLEVEYSPRGDASDFRPLELGSPGQRAAAVLAFLLAYGNEPLILDQPEDDLDNSLIYDLIVKRLRATKQHRQIIVVTHNANIVVNGDAELVVALSVRHGLTQTDCQDGLQERNVRETICKIMEGGVEAFRQRYRRILPGEARVRHS